VWSVKVAVTVVAAETVTTHDPVPVHPPPLQPLKIEPAAGVAVSVTAVPLAKLAAQVAPQVMPAGSLVSVPVPVPPFETVSAEVVALPAASRSLALSVWAPLGTVVVFQDTEYGATRSSAPRLAPSSLHCTPTTPTLSSAAAETVTVFETVAPPSCALIETVGGVVSDAAATRHPT